MSRFGRKSGLIKVDIVSIIGILCHLIAFNINSNQEGFFIAGRIICGICSGMNEVLLMLYIKEMSPDAIC